MKDENSFWLVIIAIVVIVFMAITSIGTSHWESKYKIIASMVEKGADPIRAACSLELGNSVIRECILEIAKK